MTLNGLALSSCLAKLAKQGAYPRILVRSVFFPSLCHISLVLCHISLLFLTISFACVFNLKYCLAKLAQQCDAYLRSLVRSVFSCVLPYKKTAATLLLQQCCYYTVSTTMLLSHISPWNFACPIHLLIKWSEDLLERNSFPGSQPNHREVKSTSLAF